VTPVQYVGTSMGAVIAACFASGLPYDEVLRRITSVSRRDVAGLAPGALLGFFGESLLRDAPLRETIESLVPARRFEDLACPLTVTAVDAGNGELVLFGAGGRPHVPLVDALYASCALPLYYPPGVIGDRSYVDGGLRAVLPLDVGAAFEPDAIFAVMVGPSMHDDPPPNGAKGPGLIRAHNRAVRILMAAQTEMLLARWRREDPVPTILVQPSLDQDATFAVAAAGRYVEEGYRAASRALMDWDRRV